MSPRLPFEARRPRLLLRPRKSRRPDGPFDYGKSTGFCIDPIEKKPLNQFYPGTSVLSFGTAGCNLGCKFCQNWSIMQVKEIEQLSENASPARHCSGRAQARLAQRRLHVQRPRRLGRICDRCREGLREVGVKAVAVTAGYITPAARPAFYEYMDAANVDLKAFTERFYKHVTLSHLEPVKDTLRWLVHESNVWTEITNLIIPRENDSRLAEGDVRTGCSTPSAPTCPSTSRPFIPIFACKTATARRPKRCSPLHDIATSCGLNYAYVGNIQSPKQQTTYCPGCKGPLIERIGYQITRYDLVHNRCRHCGTNRCRPLRSGPRQLGQPAAARANQRV